MTQAISSCCRFPHNKFCPRLNKGIEYQLYAVINHQGSLQCGHCKLAKMQKCLAAPLTLDFSFVKCDDQWYECNDTVCWKMSEKDVLVSSSCMCCNCVIFS